MTFILISCLIWGFFISLFVLSPLLNAHKKIILHPLKNNHNANSHWQEIKDQLFLKLALGSCQDNQINIMSEKQALNYLCDICEKLEGVGLSWKPINKESGSISLKFIFLLLASLTVTLFAAHANESGVSSIPSDVVIPPPSILPDTGYWLPTVNQYILTPAQGILHVYYVGMFSNNFHAKSTKILLPFPKNITDVSIHSNAAATLEKVNGQTNDEIILNTPLTEGVNQIQAEFSLQANTGVASWKKNSLNSLPGVTIIMMTPKPAKIINFPTDFRSIPGDEIQFVRVGNSSSNFPEFNVVGLVPSRFFIYLLVLFFACFFIAALIISILKLKSKKQSIGLASQQEDRYT